MHVQTHILRKVEALYHQQANEQESKTSSQTQNKKQTLNQGQENRQAPREKITSVWRREATV